jgi:hypothetical protein
MMSERVLTRPELSRLFPARHSGFVLLALTLSAGVGGVPVAFRVHPSKYRWKGYEHTQTCHWSTVRFGEVTGESDGKQQVFEVQVSLGKLDPKVVRVELYADGVDDGIPIRQEMMCVRQLAGATGDYVYRATVSAIRAATNYTARVIPLRLQPGSASGTAYILWQR